MTWLWSRSRTGNEERQAPFVLERRYEDVQQGGYFTPNTAVWLTTALRESGLLRDISPENLRVLLAVLSSVNGNGAFVATPELLAPALGLSIGATRSRLERLKSVVWNGTPLLTCCTNESGLHFFQPSPHLLEERQSVISAAPARAGRIEPPVDSGSALSSPPSNLSSSARDDVIAHSRATYTRPRAEVEAEINRFLSPEWQKSASGAEEETPKEEAEAAATPEAREWLRLKRALVGVGVPHHRADALLESHAADRIARQLEWLPYRQARSPAAYVVAAIEKDYAPPPAVSFKAVSLNEQEGIGQQAAVSPDASPPSQHEKNKGKKSNSAGIEIQEIEIQGLDVLSHETDRKEADEPV